MRILLSSHAFAPGVGGLETAGMIFAKGFAERGHQVVVVTGTPGESQQLPFAIVRRPGVAALLELVRNADIVWHNNISLRTLWPLAIVRRPLIVTHQTWLGAGAGWGRWRAEVKRLACARGHNVFISQALAEAARLPGPVIPNPYDDRTFRVLADVPRDREIAFVGRLVHDKGADVLIDALALLAARNRRLTATVIGDGTEAARLKERAVAAGIGDLVAFAGPMYGAALVRELNRHRILAVPSRWKEPFGIVALEGAACGCVVIGTAGGGLPEAIGPSGLTVANADPAALADRIGEVTANPELAEACRQRAPAHLAKYTETAIIDAYEKIITGIVAAGPDRDRTKGGESNS